MSSSFSDICLFCTKTKRGSGIENIELSDVTQYDTQTLLGECIICLDEMRPGTNVSLISCGHVYHTWCLNSWFLRKKLCPICRGPSLKI
jgi:hypothetical protein